MGEEEGVGVGVGVGVGTGTVATGVIDGEGTGVAGVKAGDAVIRINLTFTEKPAVEAKQE